MANIINKNILVVDDSITNLVLLEAILNTNGYSVRTAYSHGLAKKIMEKWKPDLIILDVLMPDQKKGYKFFKLVINSNKLREAKVAIVSALDNKKIIEQTLLEGAIDYMIKPINPDIFLEKVNSFLH